MCEVAKNLHIVRSYKHRTTDIAQLSHKKNGNQNRLPFFVNQE